MDKHENHVIPNSSPSRVCAHKNPTTYIHTKCSDPKNIHKNTRHFFFLTFHQVKHYILHIKIHNKNSITKFRNTHLVYKAIHIIININIRLLIISAENNDIK